MLDNSTDDLKNKIKESLDRLLKSKKIDETQYNVLLDHYFSRIDQKNFDSEEIFDELLKMFTETNFISQKLSDILNSKIISYDFEGFKTEPSNIEMDSYDISIIDVDDGAFSSYTGIVPINEIKDEYNQNEGQSMGIQKSIGTHPGAGKFLHFGEDGGFMTFLLVIFLAGISSGIIFMIVLNFLAK